MSIVQSHLKLQMKLHSQERTRYSNISSLNYTKYSSFANEICETTPSFSHSHLNSNKCTKIKSKFLKAHFIQAPFDHQIVKKLPNHRHATSFRHLIKKNGQSPMITTTLPNRKAHNNCLNIMNQGLTERNIRNSLLITIASIRKKPEQLNKSVLIQNNPKSLNIKQIQPKRDFNTHNAIYAKYLTHDLKYKYDIPFSLVNSMRFKPEHRLIHDIEIANYDEINALAIKKTLEDNFKIEGTVSDTAKVINYQERKKTNQILINKFIRVLIRAAIDFQQLHITLDEFYANKYTSISAFQNEGSSKLIQNVKEGNIKEVVRLILDNKYLVRDFDYFQLTALHWAVKRNRYKVISQMIFVGANVNSQDCIGRTPLHYAVFNNRIEALLVLLYEMASPTIRDKSGKIPSDYTNDYKLNYILHRAESLHILHDKGTQKTWKKSIRTGLLYCFVDDLKLTFDLKKYRIVINNDGNSNKCH